MIIPALKFDCSPLLTHFPSAQLNLSCSPVLTLFPSAPLSLNCFPALHSNTQEFLLLQGWFRLKEPTVHSESLAPMPPQQNEMQDRSRHSSAAFSATQSFGAIFATGWTSPRNHYLHCQQILKKKEMHNPLSPKYNKCMINWEILPNNSYIFCIS